MFIVYKFSKSSISISDEVIDEEIYVDVLDTSDGIIERHTLQDLYINYSDVNIVGLTDLNTPVLQLGTVFSLYELS